MSKKLENLHNVAVSKILLEPYPNLGLTKLNETWMDSHLMSPLDLSHEAEVSRLLMNATVDGISSLSCVWEDDPFLHADTMNSSCGLQRISIKGNAELSQQQLSIPQHILNYELILMVVFPFASLFA